MPESVSVLFVCLGNICRSTMAEGVFRSLALKEPYKQFDIKIDSCGTAGYHVGDTPDDRTMATLGAHGIHDYVHHGRRLSVDDFDRHDYIFAMDRDNLRDIQRLQRSRPGGRARVMLFGEYAGGEQGEGQRGEVVSDPYYGGSAGFEKVYEQVRRFSQNFLREAFPGAEGASERGRGC